MQIKALENFAHIGGRVFQIGEVYEVTEKSAAEFIAANLAIANSPQQEEKTETKGD